MTGNKAALLDELRRIAGDDSVRTDDAALALASGDAFVAGERPVAVVRPTSAATLAAAVVAATSRGFAVIPRGGGLSYTGGYTSPTRQAVTIDTTVLNGIIEISGDDLFVTVEAGVTWKQLHDALAPRGLRLPFFGTFSGAGATVGGGLSHGALFFGSARYGGAADIALGLEVALADGTLLRTGQQALKVPTKPVWRGFGPDLTGLFLHDGGAFGIKTEATLRLIRTPRHLGFASFAFDSIGAAAKALSEVAREGLAEDAYVLEGEMLRERATDAELGGAARTALATLRTAGSFLELIQAAKALARGLPSGAYTLHIVAASRSRAAVAADLAAARHIAIACGGRVAGALIPRAARADPFPGLSAIIDQDGSRWAALNAKVAHSEAARLIDGVDALLAQHRAMMKAHGVTATRLLSALGSTLFSFEVIFHWRDSWSPLHHAILDAEDPRRAAEPAENRRAFDLVTQLRAETADLFRQLGAASNQIGRTYPYLAALTEPAAAALTSLKRHFDAHGLVNPGVLGLAHPD